MKLALLGTNDDVLRLAAAARELGHEIIWVGDVRPEDADGIALLGRHLVDRSNEWEALLDRAVVDAVVVGRGLTSSELRAEQLKRLATEAMPLLVVHPVCDSVLPYYEVDMTRREAGGIVRHYNPLSGHPVVLELAGWLQRGHPTLGSIFQITCERRLFDAARGSTLEHLARDIELLAAVAGDIRRVTAIGPRAGERLFAALQVQMTASGPASCAWSVHSSRGMGSGLEMRLVGEHGTATLLINENTWEGGQIGWELATVTDERQQRQPLESYDAPSGAIAELAEAVAEASAERRSAYSTWESATRAMEVVDAVELSLEKGRTIDVYQQQLTERLAFRGTMAALGCGVLLVGFMAVVLVTILGGAEGAVGRRLLPAWPLILLAVLALFLAMQFVPFLAGKPKRRASQETQMKPTGPH